MDLAILSIIACAFVRLLTCKHIKHVHSLIKGRFRWYCLNLTCTTWFGHHKTTSYIYLGIWDSTNCRHRCMLLRLTGILHTLGKELVTTTRSDTWRHLGLGWHKWSLINIICWKLLLLLNKIWLYIAAYLLESTIVLIRSNEQRLTLLSCMFNCLACLEMRFTMKTTHEIPGPK